MIQHILLNNLNRDIYVNMFMNNYGYNKLYFQLYNSNYNYYSSNNLVIYDFKDYIIRINHIIKHTNRLTQIFTNIKVKFIISYFKLKNYNIVLL